MILVIDNYDSFTYNLVHLVASSTDDFRDFGGLPVKRNDKISLQELRDLNPDGILISPGPGRPADAGISKDIVNEFTGQIPILGVCLGHQIIGEQFGGVVTYAPTLMHGKTSQISHDGTGIFEGVVSDFKATRYHSLVVAKDSFSDDLIVSASTHDGTIMGLRHKTLALEGIQFHPESILTIEGPKLISNWVRFCYATSKSSETSPE